ncbi:MAG TPA: ATP-binding protein [Clostridiaceae bacterium]
MFKRLSTKFFSVFLCLVIMAGIIALCSSISIYSLGKSINGIMSDNYKSIKAINNMNEALEKENEAILSYIISKEEISSFDTNNDYFLKQYSIVANNVTEKGEGNLVDSLNLAYTNYVSLFNNLQKIVINKNEEPLIYFNNNIKASSSKITSLLKSISDLNENSMFNRKNAVTEFAQKSFYIIIAISIVIIIIGFIISIVSLKKILYPIYSLMSIIKAVKEGNLEKIAPILSSDEIGELTVEFNNMTKRLKQFEDSTLGKLYEEKVKSLAIVRSFSDPLIVLDMSYKVVLINEAWENFFNIKEDFAINKHVSLILENKTLFDHIENIYNSGEIESDEKIMLIHINHKDYYFNVIVNVLKYNHMKISGVVILLQNVTALKTVENMKSTFIETISHEFKTPLTSIMFGASLLKEAKIGILNEKQNALINDISDNGDRLLALVNDLLSLSKVESKDTIFNIGTYEVKDIIEKSYKVFYEQAKAKSVYLQNEVENSLPSVSVDMDKTVWALNNLISNSLKYSSVGGKIIITASLKLNHVCIFVKDNGMGIPEDYQDRIFDKFVQVKGYDSETKGTGLGLAIAKEIIKYQGGEIWCESKLGEGSTFIFTIPVKPEEEV